MGMDVSPAILINGYALDEDIQTVSLLDTNGSKLSFPSNGVEEQSLKKIYGEKYTEYCKRVRRFL